MDVVSCSQPVLSPNECCFLFTASAITKWMYPATNSNADKKLRIERSPDDDYASVTLKDAPGDYMIHAHVSLPITLCLHMDVSL